MNLRLESSAGFQSGTFSTGAANNGAGKYSKQSDAATKTVATDVPAHPPSPQRVAAIAEKSITEYPKLVGPEAPASLLFEVSLVLSAKKRGTSELGSAHIEFPRMINRRWVPSPSEIRMLEEANKSKG